MQFNERALLNGLSPGGQVSRGLNLVLELKHPLLMPPLLMKILLKGEQIRKALNELHFVHFARFLPLRDQSALLVITEFDGPLDPYVLDFVIAIGDVFDTILDNVKDHPPLPVRDHPREFMEFVRRNNEVYVAPAVPYLGEYPLYSAYPDRTVIDIKGRRNGLPPAFPQPAPAGIERPDVQGNILNGYNASVARHFALRINDPAVGRKFLEVIVDGDQSECPLVSSAKRWKVRPLYFLNIGVTAAGLKALGVPKAMQARLPTAFLEGPADRERAERNGDTGPSAPTEWELGGLDEPVHLLVSLYADDKPDSMEEFQLRSSQLTAWWKRNGIHLGVSHDVMALPGKQVHFGYREGMAQPRIAGVPHDVGVDMQPLASAGEFLLGAEFVDVYGGNSLKCMPPELCQNATFAAVRILDQDVAQFEHLLDEAHHETGMDREWLAAKLMGRWRNGTPLAMAPFAPQGLLMPARVAESDYNEFDYAPSAEHPAVPDDHHGLTCPVGAHMRRMNPRSALVAGHPYSHRLIRRGMPYGPAWDAGKPSERRGLYGLFLCADLERQFEFLLQQWANGDVAASGIRGTQDPIIGARAEAGEFHIPMEGRATPLKLEVPRLVTTRGSLYILMPGLQGLRFLAAGAGFTQAALPAAKPQTVSVLKHDLQGAVRFHPRAFNPKDPRFLANPYPYYAGFRENAPVSLVKHADYESYWVFSHELVTKVCNGTELFLKEPAGKEGTRGLFFMDPPRHAQVRELLDPLFLRAIETAAATSMEQAQSAIYEIRKGAPWFDLIGEYSNRVTRNVFMKMFGVPQADWATLGAVIDTILKYFDQLLPTWQRAPAGVASGLLWAYFNTRRAGCPAHVSSTEFLCQMAQEAREGRMEDAEVTTTAVHFALGGYLSTDFLVGTAIHNLLSRPSALKAFRAADTQGRLRALEELKRFDAPFQMADRFAAEDTQLGECEIPAGARVTVVYGSANRDENVFGPDADDLDLTRSIPAGQNYVFGHGIHHCIGEPMVAQVAPVAIELILDVFPKLAIGKSAERYQDPYFRAFSRLELQS